MFGFIPYSTVSKGMFHKGLHMYGTPPARVDPFEPNRVWWTVRGNGTHTGQAVPGTELIPSM